jgi:hypothetical protein
MASSIALADSDPYRGPYFGIESGQALHHADVDEINRNYLVEEPARSTADDVRFGYAVYGGYRFFKYLSVDAGFMDLGHATVHIGYHAGYDCSLVSTCTPIRKPPTTISGGDIRGARFRANGYWPISRRWSLDARLGLALVSGGDSGSILPVGGAGMSFSVSQSLRARLFWDQIAPINRVSEATDFYSFGLGYQF